MCNFVQHTHTISEGLDEPLTHCADRTICNNLESIPCFV
jgi:hypothetical protein